LHSPLSSGRRRAEQALRREAQLLELLLDNLEVPVLACAADGRTTQASQGARDLLGDACAPGAPQEMWIERLRARTPEGLPLSVADLPPMRAIRERAPRALDLVIETARGLNHLTAWAHPLGEDCAGAATGALSILTPRASRPAGALPQTGPGAPEGGGAVGRKS
jgi:PAS domain-containing protein